MNRVFRKVTYISIAVSALCAKIVFCASVANVVTETPCNFCDSMQTDLYTLKTVPCSQPFGLVGQQEISLPSFDSGLPEPVCSSYLIYPSHQKNLHDCIWLTSNRTSDGNEQSGSSPGYNTTISVVTASAEGGSDASNPYSGILMIVTSVLALGGYMLERIIVSRNRSSY